MNVLLGDGVFYFDYGEDTETEVGVTRGMGKFSVEREYKPIERDNTFGTVKGEVRKVKVVPKLEINSLELSIDNLEKFFGLVANNEENEYTKLTENVDILDGEYLTNVAFVGKRKDGKEVTIIVENALGNGNIEMAFNNKDEVVLNVAYEGCYDPKNLTTPPYEIRYYNE